MFRWSSIKGTPLNVFFKNVTSDTLPTCAQANEYLAEDRIMCLQIYIKENEKFRIGYVPDAKAFTDAPNSLTILMKQRRRWMNGSLFGTYKVLLNFFNMIGCNTSHSFGRKLMIFVFMIYLFTTFLLQLFMVGSLFATIAIFVKQIMFWLNNTHGYDLPSAIIYKAFTWGYGLMLILTIFVSIALPIDRAMYYLRAISFIMGLLFITSLVGITTFLFKQGFYPYEFAYNEDTDVFEKTDTQYFSWLVCAGVITLSVYAMPFILRPIDFLCSPFRYICGFMAYILMLPVFSNVFQIYAISNLHDVSWGNRPTSTGAETFTSSKVS
jgi:chitin synthase